MQCIKKKYDAQAPFLDERRRRLFAGTEAAAIGHGGISAVSRATGMSRNTIRRGLAELSAEAAGENIGRVRKPGGGRKQAKHLQPGLLGALRDLVEPIAAADAKSGERVGSRSLRKLSAALRERGFAAGRTLVARLLRDEIGFILQANASARNGEPQSDRRTQIERGFRPEDHSEIPG